MALETVEINAGGSNGTKAKKVYPLVKLGMHPMQLMDITERKEPAYGKPDELVQKISFWFTICDGPFKGSRFWKNVTPTLSRASGDGDDAKKESNLHKVLKALINQGEDLSDAQIKAFQDNPVAMLNALVDYQRPGFQPLFVEGYVTVENGKKKNPETGKPEKYNKLVDVNYTDETYEPYVYTPQLDPRNEGEDESIICQWGDFDDADGETCDRLIRGWEKSNGEWYSQEEWAAYQDKKYGGHYCGQHSKLVKAALADPDRVPF